MPDAGANGKRILVISRLMVIGTRRVSCRFYSWTCLQALALLAWCQVAHAMDPAPPPTPAPPLESVVVTGQKLPVETLIDRKVYSVTADVLSSFGALSDVLTAIPSVDVDLDGTVSLRGDSNVVILIDGKPSTQFSGSKAGDNLQAFPASDIERIEVITNPPAQFKADGAAGVINIITRKKRPKGLAGSLQGSLGSSRRSVVGADASYTSGPLTASVNAGFRHDYRERTVTSDVRAPIAPAAQVLDSSSTLSERVRRQVPALGASAQYALDDQQSVSGSVNWMKRGGLRTYTQLNDVNTASGALTGSSERMSAGHDPETDYDGKLGFSRKLSRPGEEIDLSLHRSTSHQQEHYDYTNDSLVPPGAPYYNNLNLLENRGITELGLDYALPFSKVRSVKLGYSFEQDDFLYGNAGNNVDPVTGIEMVDPNLTNDFKFRQQINSAYASYQTTLGAWSWLAGLRAELTHTDARQLTNNVSNSGSYLRAYPSLHVDYGLSDDATLSFGASRRVTRPDPSNLNPYVDHEYTPNLRSGNSNLRPQYTQSYEVAYGFQGRGLAYQVTGYYRRNRDTVTDVTEYLGNGFSLATKTNLPRNDSTGLEFTSNGRVTSKLSYSLSGNLFYNQIDASSLGVPGLRSTTGVDTKLKLDYRPTSADSAQVSFTRTDKRLTPQGYVSPINIVNVGYKHQIKPDLTAVVTLSDVFNAQRYERFLSTPTFTQDYVRAVRGRVLYVGLICSFGSTKKDKQANFEYDQSN